MITILNNYTIESVDIYKNYNNPNYKWIGGLNSFSSTRDTIPFKCNSVFIQDFIKSINTCCEININAENHLLVTIPKGMKLSDISLLSCASWVCTLFVANSFKNVDHIVCDWFDYTISQFKRLKELVVYLNRNANYDITLIAPEDYQQNNIKDMESPSTYELNKRIRSIEITLSELADIVLNLCYASLSSEENYFKFKEVCRAIINRYNDDLY